MSGDRKALRAEVEAAVLAAVSALGPDGLDKSAIIKRFEGRAPVATLYRMIDKPLKSGLASAVITEVVAKASDARGDDPAASVASDIGRRLPKIVRPEDITGPRGGTDLVVHLRQCIDIAEQVIAHARKEDGTVKNAKLLVTGGESLRRCMETAIKLQSAIRDIQQVDTLHAAIIDEIAKESPECAERIHMRMNAIMASFNFG
jgi:hypothetical protein